MRKKALNVFVSSASAKLGQEGGSEGGEQSFPRDDGGVKGDWEREEGRGREGRGISRERGIAVNFGRVCLVQRGLR